MRHQLNTDCAERRWETEILLGWRIYEVFMVKVSISLRQRGIKLFHSPTSSRNDWILRRMFLCFLQVLLAPEPIWQEPDIFLCQRTKWPPSRTLANSVQMQMMFQHRILPELFYHTEFSPLFGGGVNRWAPEPTFGQDPVESQAQVGSSEGPMRTLM